MSGGRAVTEAFAQLARDERSVLTFEPPSAAQYGWQSSAKVDDDNGGVRYSTVDFRRGFDFVAPGVVASLGVEARELREKRAISRGAPGGYAAEMGLSRQALYRVFSGRDELVEAAIVERLRELIVFFADERDRHDHFADALVETSLACIETARGDAAQERSGDGQLGRSLNRAPPFAGPSARPISRSGCKNVNQRRQPAHRVEAYARFRSTPPSR